MALSHFWCCRPGGSSSGPHPTLFLFPGCLSPFSTTCSVLCTPFSILRPQTLLFRFLLVVLSLVASWGFLFERPGRVVLRLVSFRLCAIQSLPSCCVVCPQTLPRTNQITSHTSLIPQPYDSDSSHPHHHVHPGSCFFPFSSRVQQSVSTLTTDCPPKAWRDNYPVTTRRARPEPPANDLLSLTISFYLQSLRSFETLILIPTENIP